MNIEARDLRKHRLVDSAKLAFAQKGYHETSISEIVRQAGIARSTFYQYFDSKLHLFESILESFLQDLHESIKPISISAGSPTPLSQIQENLTRVLNLVLKEGDLTRILMHNTGALDRTMVGRLEDFYSQAAGMIQRSLNLGIAMNLVRPCDTRIVSYSIIGAVKEVIFQLTSSKAPRPSTPDLVSQLLEFAMGGILVQPQNSLSRSAL
jgi:TetR/AcrR family fatty acid metabolism transcriptional regulator